MSRQSVSNKVVLLQQKRMRLNEKFYLIVRGEILEKIPGVVGSREGHKVYHTYRVLEDHDITVNCCATDVAPLTGAEHWYLLAVNPPRNRVAEVIMDDKMEWVMKLRVGDNVTFKSTMTKIPSARASGRIHYIGPLAINVRGNGVFFGVEISNENYRGHGTTDGSPHFNCGPNNAVWLSMDELVYQPIQSVMASWMSSGVNVTKRLVKSMFVKEQQVIQSRYNEGDRVVTHSFEDHRPIFATVISAGLVQTSRRDGLSAVMFVRIETDSSVDPDVDFPRTHANTLKSQFPKTIPADRKLCLPEYLLMFEEEHEKQVLAEEDVMTTAAYHLQAREIDLSKSVLSDLDVEKQRKRLSEISFRDNEEPNNETHKELEQKEIPHKWLTIINAAVLLKCKDKLLKGSVKFIGFVPEFGGLVGGVELECPMSECADGSYNGRRYFTCEHGRGYFCPVEDLQLLDDPSTLQVPSTGAVATTTSPTTSTPPLRKAVICKEAVDDYQEPVIDNVITGEPNLMKEAEEYSAREKYESSEKEKALTREQEIIKQQQLKIAQLQEEVAVKSEIIKQVESTLAEKTIALTQEQEAVKQLKEEVAMKSETDISFWLVSHDEIQYTDDVKGSGAYGQVVVGYFRGQQVAVKTLHESISSPYFNTLLHREISMMIKVRHPNLLLFIAAALDSPSKSPIIITELLDTSLRRAYRDGRLCSDQVKVSIMRDVAAALNYLHLLKEPIIHRDVSSANVLLQALPDNCWRAKLSDFGSANLARYSVTAAPGALLYTAPEVSPSRASPKVQQFPSLDVYSYGVLLCEVFASELPYQEVLPNLLQLLSRTNPSIHQIITSCLEEDPNKRPTMTDLLDKLVMP